MRAIKFLLAISLILLLTACRDQPWNNPYPTTTDNTNTYYSSFSEQPKTLDPARSYSDDESLFIGEVYEPPLQYDYLKRPYTLIPLTATVVPQPVFFNAKGQQLKSSVAVNEIAYSVYTIHIKPQIYYQPHPAFKDKTHTRELVADDYIYQIKRLADPQVQSPIFGLLSNYIVGFTEFNNALSKLYDANKQVDLRTLPLNGVKLLDRYTYSITIKGYYPQFLYWLAMSFFAPMPWEVAAYYAQPGFKEHDMTLDWYPVGTGPYMLVENNPNRQMVLQRNPNFHPEYYPTEGMPGDKERGLLTHAGQLLPFIDKFVFTLEKESIPRWNKFLQGYYDQSAIGADSFEEAIQIAPNGQPETTPLLKSKNIRLQTDTTTSAYYMGFNLLDPVVGGYTERARKLRQALAIVLDEEEFIAIFLNGRGMPAQGPLPPSVFGYRSGKDGINPYVYDWVGNQAKRKSVAEARRLLAEAGYPEGYDPKTKQPLLLYFDTVSGGTGDDEAYFAWLRKQFAKLNIQLQVRDTQANRFQDKLRTGQVQLFSLGWNADYPDPENFLFLFYGSNGQVDYGGENNTNYKNASYDQLFLQMRSLPNGLARQTVIDQMLAILRYDSPWIGGFYPQSFVLSQSWVSIGKPNQIANNTLKYMDIDPPLRAKMHLQWNRPIIWPLGMMLVMVLVGLVPVIIYYIRKQRRPFQKSNTL